MRLYLILFIGAISALSPQAFAAKDAQVHIPDMSSGLFRFQMKLATQGNPEAQYKVAEMLEAGKGTQKDVAQARSWFEKAAAQGHEKSIYKLLYMEIQANGLNDYSRTQLETIKSKAAAGMASAQYYLGRMYAHGVGVPKSLDNALAWLNKATFNGMSEAESDAIEVEEELVRIRTEQARKRSAALARAKKQRLEREKQLLKQQQKQQKDKQLVASIENKNRRRQEAEKLARERQKIERERALIEAEKARLEAQQRQQEAEFEKLKAQKLAAEKRKKKLAKFEIDPCKGKKARFLSTCR